eukprot:scaffold9645_cov76-Phaeocystis_antarctica.AAC.3
MAVRDGWQHTNAGSVERDRSIFGTSVSGRRCAHLRAHLCVSYGCAPPRRDRRAHPVAGAQFLHRLRVRHVLHWVHAMHDAAARGARRRAV